MTFTSESIVLQDVPKPSRLSSVLAGRFALLPTKSAAKKAIKKGAVFVNNLPGLTSTFVKNGDIIKYEPPLERSHVKSAYSFDICYEDDYLAVINKPSDISVSGNVRHTIANYLPGNLASTSISDALPVPRPIHRLDKLTSGLLIIAKTKTAELSLQSMMSNRTIDKEYALVVEGTMDKECIICEAAIEDKVAKTAFTKIDTRPSHRFGHLTLLKAKLFSGRTHQIRLHCQALGIPILGDGLHGSANTLRGKGLFLCACDLSMKHPITGANLRISIDPPTKFVRYMKYEEKRNYFAQNDVK